MIKSLRAYDIDRIFAAQDSDHISHVGMCDNYLLVTHHRRKRVVFLLDVRPFIREAFDQVFKYEFPDREKLEEMYKSLIKEKPEVKYIWGKMENIH